MPIDPTNGVNGPQIAATAKSDAAQKTKNTDAIISGGGALPATV